MVIVSSIMYSHSVTGRAVAEILEAFENQNGYGYIID